MTRRAPQAPPADPAVDDLDRGGLVGAMRRATVALEAAANAAQAQLGIARTDLMALELLTLGRLTAGEIAEQVGVSTGTTTAVVDRLAEAGYALRETDPDDRRRTVVAITAKGRRRFRQAYQRRWQWLHDIARELPPQELEVVVRFLARVRELTPPPGVR